MQTEANAGAAGPVSDGDLIAELRALKGGADKAPPAPPAPGKELADAADDAADEPAEEEAKAEAEATEVEAKGPEAEVKVDEETQKRLAALQHRERKHNERIAADQAKLEALRKEWEPRIEEAKKFTELKGKGLRGFVEAAEHFGLTADDFETAARALYARSPAAAKNPATKAAAEQTVRERELEARVAAAEKRAAAVEQRLTEREQQAQTQAQVDKYLGGIEAAAKAAEDAPLVRKLVEKTPAKARLLFNQVALDLLDELGETPEPAAVVSALEQRRRAELAEMGIDPATVLGAAQPKEPEKKKPSRTLGNSPAGTVASTSGKPKTGRELDAEVALELRALRSSGTR